MIQKVSVVVIFLLIINNVNGNGRIEQQNIGIPDSPSSDAEQSSSSSSQYITQQNIGIPDSGSNQQQSLPSSSSSSSLGSGFVPQQNIGIPDIPAMNAGGGSFSSSYGSSSQQRPSGYFPQLNIMPASRTGSSSVMVMTGGGPSIPLAVNSHHTIQYVDMPSTMTRNYQQSSRMNTNQLRPGYSNDGSNYITQQNIGIPGPSNYGGGGSSNRQVITLPVHSRHTIEYVDVPSTGNIQPINIEVPATRLGANFNFRSSSSLKVSQSHQSSPGSYQQTSSMDEPIRLSHTVHRPIIQELRETIQPYRKVVQEIQPVQQEIHQIIAVARKPSGTGSMTGSSKSNSGSYYRPGSGSMMIPQMMMINSGMYGGDGPSMVNPIMMYSSSSGSSGYGTMMAPNNQRRYGSKTKPYGGSSPIGMSPNNDLNSSSSLGGGMQPSPQQQPSPQLGGQKGNRRFYDGSYGITQQKI